MSLLIHLLLLPAVICALQLAALNTVPEILKPRTCRSAAAVGRAEIIQDSPLKQHRQKDGLG